MTKPELDYDRYFSLYIRHRDCPDGRGYCITCGAPITPKTCYCGHYIGRAHKATRWDERNCHAQCKNCNERLEGLIPVYRKVLIRLYGLPTVEELERKKRTIFKLSRSEMSDKINYYKRLIRNV